MNKDTFEDKDILELFNYINIDKDEEEEKENLNMDDLRKKRLKKNLLKQVKGKKTRKNFKYKAIAASLIMVVILISLNIPAVAKNISEFKSVIQALVGYGVPKEGEYEKYSNVINKSVTHKGITLTINEVVCDEEELMISYTIKSKGNIKKIVKERKETSPIYFSLTPYIKIDGKSPYGGGGSSDGKYLDSNTYINSDSIDIGNMNLKNNFDVDLNVNNIYGIQGKWNFKFSVSKDEILKHTKLFKPNTKVKFEDAFVNVEKISFTPINTTISVTGKYNKKEYKDSEKLKKAFNVDVLMGYMIYEWFVFDDMGNEMMTKGCYGDDIENSSSKDFYYNLKFINLTHIPKYLTVIPYRYINNNGSIQETYKNINGVYPIELSQGSLGKLIIKEIETQKDKTMVKYKVEGKAPFLQAKELFIMDDKGNGVLKKDNNFQMKKDNNIPNEYIMEFQPLDKNKKYKVGTSDLGYYEIRNDLKFRIDLN